MKLGLITFSGAFFGVALALTGCATTSNDPYAANHSAPAEIQRAPSSDESCEAVAPRCQLGDSYEGTRTPASVGVTCKETTYYCEQTHVSCKEAGVSTTTDTLDYVAHTSDCRN